MLRPATSDDLTDILALPALGRSTRSLLAMDLARVKARHIVVAETPGGDIVGFGMTTAQPDEVHVLDLAVTPAQRRRGIARRVLVWLATAAMADGATAMTLEVRHSNTGAQALYLGLGFADHGICPGYYQDGEDAVIMWRDDLAGMANDPATAVPPSMTRTA